MAFFLKPDKDWVDRLDATCSLDAFGSAIPNSALRVPNSVVSPACLEGNGRYLSMMSLSGSGVPPLLHTIALNR